MKRWRLWGAIIAAALLLGTAVPALAQDVDYGDPAQFDRQPPPPPPPADRDYGPGYYRREPPSGRILGARRSLVCSTPEGACAAPGARTLRGRCGCAFGDGWVRGRLRP